MSSVSQTVVAFGKSGLPLQLPAGPQYEILHARAADPLRDVGAALDAALDSPLGCAPLTELARGKRSAAISVCDITRPAPNRITLPPLLERLHRAGLKRENITLCIATGLHRQATPAELNEILGSEIASSYPIANHDAKDFAAHRHVGDTHQGTKAYIDKRFLDADLHITLGFIEQHLMLGFSGGRKLIAPGLAAQETIKIIHSPRFMRESRAVECSIDDNPLHAELLEIARMARHDFILDVTLTQDKSISGIFAGEPVQAHAAGVRFLRDTSTVYLPQPADAVITTGAGHPLDLTLYQTLKGTSAAQHIVKRGGPILTIGECSEGIGSPEFTRMMSGYTSAQSFLDEIKDTPVIPDQWQMEKIALVGLKHPVLLYTPGVDPKQLGSLRETSYASVEEALRNLVSGLPPHARVAVIPDGPYACVRLRDA